MGTDTALLALVIGSTLLFGALVLAVVVLCLRALRHNAEIEAEVRGPSHALRVRIGSGDVAQEPSGLITGTDASESSTPENEVADQTTSGG